MNINTLTVLTAFSLLEKKNIWADISDKVYLGEGNIIGKAQSQLVTLHPVRKQKVMNIRALFAFFPCSLGP